MSLGRGGSDSTHLPRCISPNVAPCLVSLFSAGVFGSSGFVVSFVRSVDEPTVMVECEQREMEEDPLGDRVCGGRCRVACALSTFVGDVTAPSADRRGERQLPPHGECNQPASQGGEQSNQARGERTPIADAPQLFDNAPGVIRFQGDATDVRARFLSAGGLCRPWSERSLGESRAVCPASLPWGIRFVSPLPSILREWIVRRRGIRADSTRIRLRSTSALESRIATAARNRAIRRTVPVVAPPEATATLHTVSGTLRSRLHPWLLLLLELDRLDTDRRVWVTCGAMRRLWMRTSLNGADQRDDPIAVGR